MHENEQLVRAMLSAVASGDRAGFVERFADDTVWHMAGRNPMAGDHHGRDACLSLSARIAEVTSGTVRAEVHDVLANDDHAVALFWMTATTADSRITWPRVCVYHIRDGLVAELWFHEGDQHGVDALFSGAP